MIIALLALTPLSLGNASLNVTSNNYQVKIEQVDSSYTDPLQIDILENLHNEQCEEELLVRRGCCSWHGGVCGCDTARDRIICCDGTYSPTCRCSTY